MHGGAVNSPPFYFLADMRGMGRVLPRRGRSIFSFSVFWFKRTPPRMMGLGADNAPHKKII